MTIAMTVVYNNFKRKYSGGAKFKRRERDGIQRDSTILLADTVILKLPNLLEGLDKFSLNNNSAPGTIPYIHLDASPTTIYVFWKVPELCSLETNIFIEKEPSSYTSRARERRIIKFIEHLPADGIFQYSFTNLPPGETFKFRIRAFNSVGQGPFSTWVEKSTLCLSPEPPDLECIEWSCDSLTLSWQNMPKKNILYYVVEMKTSMGMFKKIYEGSKLKFKLISLKADKVYHFRICAIDQSRKRKGPYSTPRTFSTCFRLIGDSNQTLKAIGLWKHNSEYVQRDKVFPSTTLSQINMRASYKYERKKAMQNFEEMVKFALTSVPSAINKINIYSLIDSFYLSWTQPTFNSYGIKNYNIELQASNNVNKYLLNTKENIQKVLLMHLDDGTTYNIRIQAVNESGAGRFSQILEVATLHKISQPPELRCKIFGETYLQLEWGVESIYRNGVLSYAVELKGECSFYTVYQGLSCSCILDMLKPNKEYFFRISAFCSAGRSDYSKLYCFKTLLPLYKPEIYGCRSLDEDSQDSEGEFMSVEPKQCSGVKFTYYPPTEKSGVELCSNDIDTLNPETYLNDAVIEFYLKYLYCERLTEMEKEKTYIFSSFFFSRLIKFRDCSNFPEDETQMERYESIKTWTRRFDLFSKDFLIVPINHLYHWMVAIICFPGLAPDISDNDVEDHNLNDENTASSFNGNSETKERRPCICIFDSMKPEDVCHNNATVLREFLDLEWTVRKGTKKLFNESTMPEYNVNCPQQPNGFDCGIFLLQNVETFFENQIPFFDEDLLDFKSEFSMEIALRKRQEIKTLMLELLKKSLSRSRCHLAGTQ